MRFLLLVNGDREAWSALNDAEREAWQAAHDAARAEAQRRGIYVGSEPLKPAKTSRFVRVRDGKPIVVDGAHPETKEQLGGYYLLDARDADEAAEIAALLPDARTGFIEVRPIQEMAAGGRPAAAYP